MSAVVDVARARSDISIDLAAAIKAGDQQRLVALLGARTNVACMVFPAKEDDSEDQKVPDEQEEEKPDETKGNLEYNALRVAVVS